MNYFLHYSGKLPEYHKITINNILSVDKDAKIYFCSDEKIDSKYVTHCYPDQLNNEFIEMVSKINYFKDEKNQLWNTSLLRIYYLFEMAKLFSVDKFVHFDLDVMIYEPFDNIKDNLIESKFNITPMTELDLIFGYSYVSSLENYFEICSDTIEILNNINYFEKKFYNSKKVNEMMLLNFALMKNPNNFHLLTTLPNFNDNEVLLFDPAQYGHHLCGVDKKLFVKNTFEEKQYIGREILEKGYKVKFKNNQPLLFANGKKYKIVNLHVHKKNLHKFKSRTYKCLLK